MYVSSLSRVLSSDAVLSTDEESSSEETSDLDELGKDLESMLSNKKSKHEVFILCFTFCVWLDGYGAPIINPELLHIS